MDWKEDSSLLTWNNPFWCPPTLPPALSGRSRHGGSPRFKSPYIWSIHVGRGRSMSRIVAMQQSFKHESLKKSPNTFPVQVQVCEMSKIFITNNNVSSRYWSQGVQRKAGQLALCCIYVLLRSITCTRHSPEIIRVPVHVGVCFDRARRYPKLNRYVWVSSPR